MPREFVKDGRQFITRCSKRTFRSLRPCKAKKRRDKGFAVRRGVKASLAS